VPLRGKFANLLINYGTILSQTRSIIVALLRRAQVVMGGAYNTKNIFENQNHFDD
jgi:hypothetical protein